MVIVVGVDGVDVVVCVAVCVVVRVVVGVIDVVLKTSYAKVVVFIGVKFFLVKWMVYRCYANFTVEFVVVASVNLVVERVVVVIVVMLIDVGFVVVVTAAIVVMMLVVVAVTCDVVVNGQQSYSLYNVKAIMTTFCVQVVVVFVVYSGGKS